MCRPAALRVARGRGNVGSRVRAPAGCAPSWSRPSRIWTRRRLETSCERTRIPPSPAQGASFTCISYRRTNAISFWRGQPRRGAAGGSVVIHGVQCRLLRPEAPGGGRAAAHRLSLVPGPDATLAPAGLRRPSPVACSSELTAQTAAGIFKLQKSNAG